MRASLKNMLASLCFLTLGCDAGVDIENLKKRALYGSAEASYRLGVIYGSGYKGVDVDEREAVYWLRRAADKGHGGAQYRLGIHYAHGRGVTLNAREAVAWWKQAAARNHPDALYHVGLAYVNGVGARKDILTAVDFYKRAALLGHGKAQLNLALIFLQGSTGIKRPIAAAALLHVVARTSQDQDLQNKSNALLEQLAPALDETAQEAIKKETAKLLSSIANN